MTHAAAKLLVLDIGNSGTKLGLWRHGRISLRNYLDNADIMRSPGSVKTLLESAYGGRRLVSAVASSVAPEIYERLHRLVREALGLETGRIDHTWDFGMPLSYPEPGTLGVDRLVNAAWAHHAWGAPVIVCDFGTCATIDLVLPGKGFVGGVIAPGLDLFARYMAERTAQLPRIPLATTRRRYGRSTREAMQIAADRGYAAMIRELIGGLRQVAGPACRVCLTGGSARKLARRLGLPDAHVDATLTLAGIGLVGGRHASM